MNTAALKKFAPAVRNQLIAAISLKLEFVLAAQTPDYLGAYARQVDALRRLAQADRPGLVERVAYTWFNRFAALRFIDAHGWHPFRARVLTAAPGETQPELLKQFRTGAIPDDLKRHTDVARLGDLLDGAIPSANPQGEVYRHLVLAACRFYHGLLPNLFEKLDDETELLLPDDLLTEQSVVAGFRTEITDEDCSEGQRANVEVLGWLYQFYISERKDQVMARKSAVPTEDIPAVTQLFTPHWIVRYLVENSLGRLWMLNRPNSRLRDHMPYYIEGEAETDFLRISKPEEIRVCDPAAGSGHMLTYAFDLLSLIYEEEGYAPIEIPALILRNNLFGLDICARAAQLAELALVLKAREKSRRFFQADQLVRPHIVELQDVKFEDAEIKTYLEAVGGDPLPRTAGSMSLIRPTSLFTDLLQQFEEAKNFGSLIQPCLGEAEIVSARRVLEAKDVRGQLFVQRTHLKVMRVLEQAEMLTQRYQVVVANPPYMGRKGMNEQLGEHLERHYENGKSDLLAAFMLRGPELLLPGGVLSCVTLDSWMFLPSYLNLRASLLAANSLSSLVHVGWNCFPEGHVYNRGVAFVLTRASDARYGSYINLSNVPAIIEKEPLFFERVRLSQIHRASATEFAKIPGGPIAYWLSLRAMENFATGKSLAALAEGKSGMSSCDSARFLRQWHEVALSKIEFAATSHDEASNGGLKWFRYNKGGGGRKWYGYNQYLINWSSNGADIKEFVVSNPRDPDTTHWSRRLFNLEYFFRPGITWSAVTSANFSARLVPDYGIIPGTGSKTLYGIDDVAERFTVVAFLNSAVSEYYLKALSPTLNFEAGDVGKLPLLPLSRANQSQVVAGTNSIFHLSVADWNNFETACDFRDLPLLRAGISAPTLAASWENYESYVNAAIHSMQELETENNRLFIDAYGLQDELKPEVPEEQITLARPDARKDVAALLSYAIGCMMGRYSLDQPGLILANAGDTVREYLAKVGKPLDELTFRPDEDGIIPFLDGEWFEDDIVARTRDFLRATFGDATLRENLRFIEESLGKELRKYFLNDFYKDHLQTYKKRPIYWLVQSPKKGFGVLIYLHRYNRDTFNLVLNRYLREYQTKVRARLNHLAQVQATATSAAEKTDARKESDKLTKIIHECEEWERQTLLPLAQQRVELDLDDGVKVNYLKLGEALATIPGLAAAEE